VLINGAVSSGDSVASVRNELVSSIGGMILTGGKPNYSEKNAFHSHSVHLGEPGRGLIYQGL